VRSLVDIQVQTAFDPVGDHEYISGVVPIFGTAYHTIWRASRGQLVQILGSSFPARTEVIITVGTDNRRWIDDVTNSDGAFHVEDIPIPSWVSTGPVSVRAWIDLDGDGSLEEEDGEEQASWPLRIQ
jgi:hypothetical protein